jgi:hypothetical protein
MVMEIVKPREEFFEPDSRLHAFKVREVGTTRWRDASLDDHYGDLDGLVLNPGVPEEVVGYINVVKTLYLYGWLYYPFFATCQCLSGMAVEMALRTRLPYPSGKRDGRTLRTLLRKAVDSGLLRDDGFPSLPGRAAKEKAELERLAVATAQTVIGPTEPYVEILVKALPEMRNIFAHPKANWIVLPGAAQQSILVAVEIINQLWS